jgi:Skp family chaperone for outer membrane proteins
MKIVRTTLLTLMLLAALTVPALAQTKAATVDMRKVFNAYYKTKLASDALDKRKVELHKDIKDMEDGLEKAQEDYKRLSAQVDDPAVSADEHTKRNAALADANKDISERKANLESYSRQAQTQLSEQSQRMTSNLVTEIQKVVADRAKAEGYTLVLNSATTEVVVYSATGVNDLSDEVIKQLNAGAPIDLTAPAPGTNATH